jgi:hypothetical protein
MRVLVTFYSQTGSTRKVAESIFHELDGEKEFLPLEEVASLDGFDLLFLGFPVIQFGPPRVVRTFLSKVAAGRKVALFVTHASWDSDEMRPALDSWLTRCRSAASASDLVGFFHCRGELSESAAQQFLESGMPEVRFFGTLRPQTIGHPDEEELLGAKEFASQIIKKLKE